MLTPVSVLGVVDDLDALLWAMRTLGGDGLVDEGPLTAEQRFDFAWQEYCTAARRLSVRLNDGDIASLDCDQIERMKLQSLWEWLQGCACPKPTYRPTGSQDFELIAATFGEMGQSQLDDLKPHEKLRGPAVRLIEPEIAIIRAIQTAGSRLTTQQVLSRVDHSESDVKKMLAYLVRFHILTSDRSQGGYGLPEWDRESSD